VSVWKRVKNLESPARHINRIFGVQEDRNHEMSFGRAARAARAGGKGGGKKNFLVRGGTTRMVKLPQPTGAGGGSPSGDGRSVKGIQKRGLGTVTRLKEENPEGS